MAHVIGERLTLREYREEDFAPMQRWVNDPETTRYLSEVFAAPYTALQREKFLQRILSGEGGGYNFVVAQKESLDYMGQIDIFNISKISRSGEVGLVLAPWAWHKGYAREAVGLLQRFAFETANLHRLHLSVFAKNTRAHAAYLACGFVDEGVQRAHVYKDGEYQDLIVMGILREEWESARQGR